MNNTESSISPGASTQSLPIDWPAGQRLTSGRQTTIRRCPTPRQGRALELLGHAVEYLVDSRLHLGVSPVSDELAVQLLMRLNREVFAECDPVVPLRRRLRRWLRW